MYPMDVAASKAAQWVVLRDKFELKEDGIVINESPSTKNVEAKAMTDKDLKKTVTGAIHLECEFKFADDNNRLSLQTLQPGLKIWRGLMSYYVVILVKKFELQDVAEKDYGVFHAGDAYIVLYAAKKFGGLGVDIHFWLGSQCTADERGTAAIKTVEIDDMLGMLSCCCHDERWSRCPTSGGTRR